MSDSFYQSLCDKEKNIQTYLEIHPYKIVHKKGVNHMQTSPVIEQEMTFPQAIEQLIVGKSVTRKEWQDEAFYGVVKDGQLQLHKPDGKFYQWIISDGDLIGTDWICIKIVS